jgi:hypothetical protein
VAGVLFFAQPEPAGVGGEVLVVDLSGLLHAGYGHSIVTRDTAGAA